MSDATSGVFHPDGPERLLARPAEQRPPVVNYGFSGDRADLDICAAAIRRGSRSFYVASLILPRETRLAAYALYAFCRHSDDLIDGQSRGPDALSSLRARLDGIYSGNVSAHACDRAFARIVHRHAIPKGIPSALLDGFAMDVDNRRYQTIADVKDYAAGVAATVGLMMSLVMGTGDSWALARAADLGLAMQLTNIARDVGEDARNGRLYLPTDWLREVGIDPDAFLRHPRHTPALASVVKRLLKEADRHYALGHAGIPCLPADCRHAIRTAALTYQEIGRKVAEADHDSVTRRATTSMMRKLSIMAQATRPIPIAADALAEMNQAPPDPSVAAMVDAAAEIFARNQVEAANARSARAATGVDRFTAILLESQARSLVDIRDRRLARWNKAASHA